MSNLKDIYDEQTKIKLFVCYYQPWSFPKENIYFPIQAGKSISKYNLKIQGDNTDDNISDKNATFSEFTAWYWVWKNSKKIFPSLEYIGLSHYRRFFALNKPLEYYTLINRDYLPNMENYDTLIKQKLEKNDIILVKPAIFGISIKDFFEHYHNASDYRILKEIVHKIYPEYDESFNYYFENNNKLSLYCLFIAKYDLFNKYFEWLFPILFEAEKLIDVSNYNSYHKRSIAFLAERLLSLYVYHNKLKACYEPIYYIKKKPAKRNIIYYFLKIIKFLLPYGIVKTLKLS